MVEDKSLLIKCPFPLKYLFKKTEINYENCPRINFDCFASYL
jgi:hypothetical protein